MADNVVANPASGGATFATDEVASVHYPRSKVVWGADGTVNDADIAAGKALPVQLRDTAGNPVAVAGGTQYTEDAAAAADPIGTVPILVRKDTPATTVSADGDNIAQRGTNYGAAYVTLLDTSGNPLSVGGGTQYTEDAPAAADPIGNSIIMVRKDVLVAVTSADGDNVAARGTDKGELYVKHADPLTRMIVAAASAMTRPANTTAYSADDAVSDNGTAGSVTAISVTVANANDAPVSLKRMRIASTDTGVQGKNFRAWLYRSNPTASSGIVGGDNAAFSTKQGTFIGCMDGFFRTFSDGAVAVMTPTEGDEIITVPTSGAATVFVLLQTLDAFTPSANSTTFTCTLEGTQGRA